VWARLQKLALHSRSCIRQSYLNKKESLDVSATGIGTGVVTQKNFEVPIFKPKILFYEKDPLLGIKYNRTLDSSFEVASGEKTIVAEPYFFGPSSALSPELDYAWTQTLKHLLFRNIL
jgi:hypothetical protein